MKREETEERACKFKGAFVFPCQLKLFLAPSPPPFHAPIFHLKTPKFCSLSRWKSLKNQALPRSPSCLPKTKIALTLFSDADRQAVEAALGQKKRQMARQMWREWQNQTRQTRTAAPMMGSCAAAGIGQTYSMELALDLELDISGQTHVFSEFAPEAQVVLAQGDALHSLHDLPTGFVQLVISSPPYNIGKSYEKATGLTEYLAEMEPILKELSRVLAPQGSLCWQVGNYVDGGEIVPLDILFYPLFKKLGLKLRNRIVWTFDHGLHASKRFSGRYETLLWFSKGDDYVFNLDPVRVPSKYPGKRHFKGEKKGQISGNPLGKNPSDIWRLQKQTALENDFQSGLWDIPNVKANHPEKTAHPCQFPIELAERCVLAMTHENDWVLDPFAGAGSSLLAALMHHRRSIGCEKEPEFLELTRQRIQQFDAGNLPYRPLGKPIHQPTGREKVAQIPAEWL